MFQGLQSDQLEGALEALLFVTDEPVNAIVMADMLEIEPAQAEEALARLCDRLASEGSGIVLREVAGGWRLFTHPAYHELVEKYVVSWDTRKLSQAALETLSIVAYSQPITRARISAVRGVNSDSSVNSLVEKGLLREVGTEDAPGNPVLYATTQTFLEKFGLRSVADLPPLESFAPDEETRRFVTERLSASRMTEGLSVPEGLAAGEANEDAAALLAFEGEGPNGEEVHGERNGAGQASLFEGEEVRSKEGDTPLSFEGEENPDVQDAMHQAMARAFAQASGAVEKIDFNELRFED
ncbi:SMC-Scp complex subunit ScpB [Slackia piriformis]|nr:SMC-Scp complex subunit ScpB [Slackia piriformis]